MRRDGTCARCSKSIHARGLCPSHYGEARRERDLPGTPGLYMDMTPERVLDRLNTEGGWVTTSRIKAEFGETGRHALYTLRRRGFIASRPRVLNRNTPENEWKFLDVTGGSGNGATPTKGMDESDSGTRPPGDNKATTEGLE